MDETLFDFKLYVQYMFNIYMLNAKGMCYWSWLTYNTKQSIIIIPKIDFKHGQKNQHFIANLMLHIAAI